MKPLRRVFGVLCVVAAFAAAAGAAQAPATREAAYAALAQLPDWSGWWGLDEPPADEFRRQPAPIKPGLVGAPASAAERQRNQCRPPTFTGHNGGFQEAVELLFTPGRVTLTNEQGLVRRIYTDGRVAPADAEPTNTGISIGHWEGQTLIVETTHINPRARYPLPIARAAPIGANARVTERIFLKDPNTLQVDVVVVAPDALTEPDRRTRILRRLPKTMSTEFTHCTEYDRSIEPDSGEERFDLTPPSDLPPPPPR
jgi:hypothetical protein